MSDKKKKLTTNPITNTPVTGLTPTQILKLNTDQRNYLTKRVNEVLQKHKGKIDEEYYAKNRTLPNDFWSAVKQGAIKFADDATMAKALREGLNIWGSNTWQFYDGDMSIKFRGGQFYAHEFFDVSSIEAWKTKLLSDQAANLKEKEKKYEVVEFAAQELIDKVWLVDLHTQGAAILDEINKFQKKTI
ncbi:MAG: hypothetical protein ACP5N7_02725 [Candidatus Pacearchaeota archaeon]